MKAAAITSTLTGLIAPWFYFLFVTVVPMNIYEDGALVSEAVSKSAVGSFIGFYGLKISALLYFKAFIFCFLVSYIICITNNYFGRQSNKNL